MGERWSKERVWKWYDKMGWLRGCNFVPSNCMGFLDMFQNYDYEEHIACADEELALAHELGFNSVRFLLNFNVWRMEHDDLLQHFDAYLELCQKHGMTAIVMLGCDCCMPKDKLYQPPKMGERKVDWGWHGGKKHSVFEDRTEMGYHLLDVPEFRDMYYEFVREIVILHKDDERICVWDLYNEPGNCNRDEVTLPHLKRFFEIAREIDPIQPLTSCLWRWDDVQFENPTPCAQFCLDNADVITYHNYENMEKNVKIIRYLRKFGRPIMNTEWLARPLGSNIADLFPLFYLENVSCYNWGLVAGKSQYYECWNNLWDRYDAGTDTSTDFRFWFHDLYRPSLRPYDPHETELIRRICDLAEQDEREKRP